MPISLGIPIAVFALWYDRELYAPYGAKQPLTFQKGQSFDAVAQVVLVPSSWELGYQLGDRSCSVMNGGYQFYPP